MTKRERMMAACAGQPVDRLPYSLWYHFRLDPPAGENMARAELAFYHRYDPDFLKVMHDIPYEMPADMPQVQSPADWAKLPVLDGKSGNFGAQLDTVRIILRDRGDDGPVIDTVFGVHSTAEKVCGKRTLEMLRQDPDAVHKGLRNLAASLANYAKALVESGADGIYLAMSGATSESMMEQEYRQHFLAYDQQVLDAVRGARFNVLHQHGENIYPDLGLGLKGYNVYSWSGQLEGNPGIKEMRLRTTNCLMCGVNETTFAQAAPEEILEQIQAAMAETNGKAFIVGPGCAVPTPPDSPEQNLHAFRLGVTGA